jgi:hypothetical protein
MFIIIMLRSMGSTVFNALDFLLVAFAPKNREPWILRKTGIGKRPLAQNKHGTARGLNATAVQTRGAQAGVLDDLRAFEGFQHTERIAA